MKEDQTLYNKSIEEIENDYWPDQQYYISHLVKRCHAYRKIRIAELQIHQIITLLIQDIGSEILLPLVLNRMNNNLFEEDDYDGSSFIQSIDFFNDEIFKKSPHLYNLTMSFLKEKESDIEAKLGWKQYKRLIQEFEKKNPDKTI